MKTLVLIATLLFVSFINAEEIIINEVMLKHLYDEGNDIINSGDKEAIMNNLKKYLYKDSEITIDMSPAPNVGQSQVDLDKYLGLLSASLETIEKSDVTTQLLSINVDDAKNTGTIKTKTIALVEMFGMKLEDVSVSETTYGVINGEIKILSSVDELISSGPVK